jgi:hypothetical protein
LRQRIAQWDSHTKKGGREANYTANASSRGIPNLRRGGPLPSARFSGRQFLKYELHEKIALPLITDVFALDAITEMLETPQLLSYFR